MFINYAHRGASHYFPENTMSAFFAGLSMGANGIETDIHRTRDDKLVLFHDDTVDRVTDSSGTLMDFTYSELYEMFVYSADRGKRDKIVLFEDFLRYFAFRDLYFAIELKQDYVEKETIELLDKYSAREKTVLTSFNPENLERARRIDGRYKIGYLVEDVNEEVIRRLRDMNGEQICPHASQVTAKNVEKWHNLGFSVRAWGVADVELMKRVADAGADGMTVNFPDLLTEYIKKYAIKAFDHTGLLLAEHQGKLFEKSTDLNCSSPVFLRRFFHSDYVKKMDLNDTASLTLDVNDGIDSIQKQFGDFNYGKTKYSKNAMFWIGYMYRYISYTRGVSTRFVMKLFPYKQLNDVYYSFHTQDPEWCVKSLLEMNNLSEEVFDNNLRLKKIIREHGNY